MAADVHLAKAVLPESVTLGQKAIAIGSNIATNKMREYTTTGGVVITANIMAGKVSTNMMFNSYNDQREMQRLNQQMVGQQFNRPQNFEISQNNTKIFSLPTIKLQPTDSH